MNKIFVITFELIIIGLFVQPSRVLTAKTNPQNNVEKHGQRFAMEPQDQTAIVGSRVTLPCRIEEKVGIIQVSYYPFWGAAFDYDFV